MRRNMPSVNKGCAKSARQRVCLFKGSRLPLTAVLINGKTAWIEKVNYTKANMGDYVIQCYAYDKANPEDFYSIPVKGDDASAKVFFLNK